MDRHHAVRVLTSHLKGKARDDEILRLLTHPALIGPALQRHLNVLLWLKSRGKLHG